MRFGIVYGFMTLGSVFIVEGGAVAAPPSITSTSVAVPSSVTTSAFLLSLRDGRLVRDVASLHLEDILSTQTWVVAKVRPDENSFRGRTVGVYFDQAHKLVVEPGVRVHDVNLEYGLLQPLFVVSGTTTAPNSYRWEYEPEIGGPPNPDRVEEQKFPIFRSGPEKTALFRIGEASKGRDQFRPAYLLDDEWVPFVQPALKYVQGNKEVFDSDLVYEHREQLQQLLSDPNPFLAVTAARTLGEAGELDGAFVQGPLAQAKGLEQSVFTFLLLQQLPRAKRLELGDDPVTAQKLNEAVGKAIAGETPVENLGKFIDSAKDAETLKAVTIGLTALLDSPQGGIFTQARVEGLLQRVLKRQKALKTNTEADAYLDASPVLMRLRQPSPATPQVQK